MENWYELLFDLDQRKSKNIITAKELKIEEFITHLAIPYKIDFDLFSENFYLLRDMRYGFDNQSTGTKSVIEILKREDIFILPMGYDEMFVALFPDVFIWVHDNMEKDRNLIDLFFNLELFKNIYLGPDNKFTISFYQSMCSICEIFEHFKFEVRR